MNLFTLKIVRMPPPLPSQVLHVPALRRRHHHRIPRPHHHGRHGEARQPGPVDGATDGRPGVVSSCGLFSPEIINQRETRVEGSLPR